MTSCATLPQYAELLALVPEIREKHCWGHLMTVLQKTTFRAVNPTLEGYLFPNCLKSVEEIVRSFDGPLVVYEIDRDRKIIWVHLGAVLAICDELNVTYPTDAVATSIKAARMILRYYVSETRCLKTSSEQLALVKRAEKLAIASEEADHTFVAILDVAKTYTRIDSLRFECGRIGALASILRLEAECAHWSCL